MTDDIVTRLRKAHISCMEWLKTQGQQPTSTIHAEAANEIERLWKLGDQLAYWARREDGAQQLISAAHAWNEARND